MQISCMWVYFVRDKGWPAACSELPASPRCPCLSLSPPSSASLLYVGVLWCFHYCYRLSATETWICHCVHSSHQKKKIVPTQGGDCNSWWVVGGVGVVEWWRSGYRVESYWACVVISSSGSGAHLCLVSADLGLASLLSKYLHANWCYLIHLSVKCFQNFKKLKRRRSSRGSQLAVWFRFYYPCLVL